MTHEEIETLLEQAAAENDKGNHAEAERLCNDVLGKAENEQTSEEKRADLQTSFPSTLHIARALNVLSWALWGRGMTKEALIITEKALATALTAESKIEEAEALHNLGAVYMNLSDYPRALEYFAKALVINEELGEKSGIAAATGNIGIVYASLGSYDKALEYYAKALAANEELGRKKSVGGTMVNIGGGYARLGFNDKALEYYTTAIAIFDEIGEKHFKAYATGNIGSVYFDLGSYDQALEYFGKALAMHEELGSKGGVAIAIGAIGEVYRLLGSNDQALEYYGKALAMYEETGEKSSIALTLGNIGELYATQAFDGYNPTKAEEFMLKGIAIYEETGEKKYDIHKALAELYESQKRWEDAFFHHKKYHDIKEEVQSEEAKKSANLMEQRKQAAEREKEIEIAKSAANARHETTMQLLHNVLPPSIADKMLTGAKIIAEKLSNVSVLFADIVEFTKLSQRITPEELVEGLDSIFSTFDALAEKHGLEKIKTIGDAYMVVSGAPIQREDHAEAMAHFALEMVESMKEFRSISTGEEIQLRIGIHSGEVVAGVIGKKKFAYDLWGDAVNTASRMESHGEEDKIHVSEEFMRAFAVGTGHDLSLQPPSTLASLLSFQSLKFVERGEIDIKGKGLMKTYFMEKL